MGWVIALGALVLLAILPLGASIRYDSGGFLVRLILGPVRLTVFPWPKKGKKEQKKPEKEAPAAKPQPDPKPQPGPQPAPQKQKGGSWTDFLPLVKLGLSLLGDFRRKLRANNLELKVTMAADDPCDLAVSYGRANGAIASLIPQLERVFVIKKRDISVRCDFTASETVVYARMDLTITLGRLLSLAAVYGVRGLREFLSLRKKRKGGALK